MFRFTQEPSSGSKRQNIAKITDMVRRCLSVRMWSVLWRHIGACCVCVHAQHVARCTCVAGTWLQDWHLPRHQGWTYRAPVR